MAALDTEHEDTQELEPGASTALPDIDAEPGTTVQERLRARRRQALAGGQFAVIDIPEYRDSDSDDAVVTVKYHAIDGAQIEAVQKRAQEFKGTARGTNACIDILAHACEGVYVRSPEHDAADEDGLVNIAEFFEVSEPGAAPVRFGDPRLAMALDFVQAEGKNAARTAVRETFCRNEPAIIAVQEALSRWFVNRNRRVDSGLLSGE